MLPLPEEARRQLAGIEASLAPLRRELLTHPLYDRLVSLDALRRFMQHHVFAVWDFMSLLKSLQSEMTCVAVPWLPPRNREACRLVNEIVLGEESDLNAQGEPASHFDLYLQSMRQCRADSAWIEDFLSRLGRSVSPQEALRQAPLPDAVRSFVGFTFSLIDSGDVCRIASAFTFGREDLLPDVFRKIVEHLDADHGGILSDFRYYLDRHIELDGDEHGPMAARLIASLCGTDSSRWERVRETAVDSLRQRLNLWNGTLAAL